MCICACLFYVCCSDCVGSMGMLVGVAGVIMLFLSTHSIDPCLWEESDHPAFGRPASLCLHLASISITPTGSVHKSSGDSVVRMWVQLKR